MLRNDLIILLSQKDNDTVTVNVNGALIDIAAVCEADGCIAILLRGGGTSPSTDSEETSGRALTHSTHGSRQS